MFMGTLDEGRRIAVRSTINNNAENFVVNLNGREENINLHIRIQLKYYSKKEYEVKVQYDKSHYSNKYDISEHSFDLDKMSK